MRLAQRLEPRKMPLWAWAIGLYVLIRLVFIPVMAAFQPAKYGYPPESSSSTLYLKLIRPWERWDVQYYVSMVRDGYGVEPATRNFYPLYAWLARGPSVLLGNLWVVGLMLTSGVATIGLYLVLNRLAAADFVHTPRWAVICFTLLPTAFILYAPYSESLFLLFIVASFLFARLKRWWSAGVMGLFATLTRQQGIIIILPLLIEMIQAYGGWRPLLKRWRTWLSLALPPLALVCLVFYRAVFLNDLPPDWWLPQNWIYAIFVSPNAKLVVPNQGFIAPTTAIYRAIQQGINPGVYNTWIARWFDLTLGTMYLVLFALAWRQMRWSYRVYSVLVFLLAFSYHTGRNLPYMGLSRHLLLAFPLAFPIANWSSVSPARRFIVLLAGGFLLVIQAILYTANAWVV